MELKRMRVKVSRPPLQGVSLSVNNYHRCRGKWKKNEWYDWYKKYPYTEKAIKEI